MRNSFGPQVTTLRSDIVGENLQQVARPAITGGSAKYTVLSDTRTPHQIVPHGPVRLSDELARNGTIAQVSHRRCSLKWKGEVLDAWIADHIAPGHLHAIGFDATEARRIARDTAISRHGRRPRYPLHEWGWDRATARTFLHSRTGRWWNRSACAHCPFQASVRSVGEWSARWRRHPRSAALALRLEHTALALHPRMTLFGARAAWDLAAAHQQHEAIALARRQIADGPWALYEIRRTITAKQVMRSVRTLTEGSRTRVHAELARTRPGFVIDERGIARAWLRQRTDQLPRIEHLIAAAPAGVADKQRRSFEHVWDDLTATAGADLCGLEQR